MSIKAVKNKSVNSYSQGLFVWRHFSCYNLLNMNNPFSLISNFSVQIDRGVVWLIFVIACALFTLFSAILLFHWEKYGMNNYRIVLAEIIYFVVSALIISSAFSSVISFIQHA